MEIKRSGGLRRRLKWALPAYACLALVAAATLDGHFRFFVLLLLGALALKCWIAVQRESLE